MASIPRNRWRSEGKIVEILPTSRVPAGLRSFFDKPPLLDDEDEKAYWDLFNLIADAISPTSAFDWLEVKDVVNALWEMARLDRVNRGLWQGSRRDVVAERCKVPLSEKGYWEARNLTEAWANPSTRKKSQAELNKLDITPDSILAGSFGMQIGSLEAAQRMRAFLESRWKRALNDIADRQQGDASTTMQPSDQVR